LIRDWEISPNDVTSAHAAGIFYIAVTKPITANFLNHADHRLDSPAHDSLQQLLWRAVESARE
jgi:beta-phosphoglucomutase-like phosphatase (HAD superfamily)